ncbi:MAG: phosphotransferase [bacterium]
MIREAPEYAGLQDGADPTVGAEALARAIPSVANGPWEIAAYRPRRFEVRKKDVALAGELVLAARNGRPSRQLAFEASHRAGEPGAWAGRDLESGLFFRVSPADPALPSLAALGSAPGLLEAMDGGPADLVAHRFERRAVLRLRRNDAPPAWMKLWAKDTASRVVELHERLESAADSFRVARAQVHDRRRRLVLFDDLAGVSLHDRLADLEPEEGERLARLLHAITSIDAPDLPAWTAADELANVDRFVERVRRIRPEAADDLAARVEAFRAESAPEDGPLGLTHRDLHDKQIVLGPDGRYGVLDWDLAAAASPALDAGNLVAHLALRGRQRPELAPRLDAVAESLSRNWCRDANDARRLDWWTRATLLRLVAVYALRPGEEATSSALLELSDHGGRS